MSCGSKFSATRTPTDSPRPKWLLRGPSMCASEKLLPALAGQVVIRVVCMGHRRDSQGYQSHNTAAVRADCSFLERSADDVVVVELMLNVLRCHLTY